MDFTFDGDQEMVRDSLSRFLAKHYTFGLRKAVVGSAQGWSSEVWAELHKLGVVAMALPSDAGGLGGRASDVVAVGEVFGEHLLVEPYLATAVFAGRALAAAPQSALAAEWLRRICEDGKLVSLAHEERHGIGADLDGVRTTVSTENGCDRLSGEKVLVIAADAADALVVTARIHTGGHALVLVEREAEGLEVSSYRTVDGRTAANCRFDHVALQPGAILVAEAGGEIGRVINWAILALAAEAVGAMQALFEMTASFAKTRKQFGQPIAGFQVIAHRLADMKLAWVKARSTLLFTAALIDSGAATSRDHSILKAQTGSLGRAVGEAAVQIHGGVGMTDELAVGHYFKRLLAIDAMFGNADYHMQRVGAC